jgi:hypothetical protein
VESVYSAVRIESLYKTDRLRFERVKSVRFKIIESSRTQYLGLRIQHKPLLKFIDAYFVILTYTMSCHSSKHQNMKACGGDETERHVV